MYDGDGTRYSPSASTAQRAAELAERGAPLAEIAVRLGLTLGQAHALLKRGPGPDTIVFPPSQPGEQTTPATPAAALEPGTLAPGERPAMATGRVRKIVLGVAGLVLFASVAAVSLRYITSEPRTSAETSDGVPAVETTGIGSGAHNELDALDATLHPPPGPPPTWAR